MIRRVMSERQAPRVRAGRPPDYLVSQANAQQRPAVGNDRAGERNGTVEPGRITRSRREDHAVHVRRQSLSRRRSVRKDADSGTALPKASHDVRLEAEIQDGNERPAFRRIAHVARSGR